MSTDPVIQHRQQINYFSKEFSGISKYFIAPWQQRYITRILSVITTKPKLTRVIDIASGSGYVAIELAKKGYLVYATDLTSESVNALKKYKKQMKLSNLTVIKCLAEKIPLPPASLDVIVANAILEHIPAEKETISHWCRLLKPKGILLITVPLKLKFIWPFLWYHNYVHDIAIGHLRRYDYADLKSKFPLRAVSVYYSGNLFKVIGLVINRFLKSPSFEKFYENLDSYFSWVPYGANNIMVIFKKEPN